MGIVNRLLLFICALLLLVLSLAGLGMALGLLPEALWLEQLRFALQQQETMLALAVLAFVSLHFLGVACRAAKGETNGLEQGEVLTLQTPNGEVQVALIAIRNLLSRVLKEVHGVRDAEVRVKRQRARKGEQERLSVRVSLVLGREVSVQKAGDAVRDRAEQILLETFGLAEVPVTVHIADVSDAPVRGRGVG